MPFAIFAIAALLSTAAAHPTTSDEARVVGAVTEQQPNAVNSQSNVAYPTTSDEARVPRSLREQQPNAVKSRSNVVHATTSDEARVLGARPQGTTSGTVRRPETRRRSEARLRSPKRSIPQRHSAASSWMVVERGVSPHGAPPRSSYPDRRLR